MCTLEERGITRFSRPVRIFHEYRILILLCAHRATENTSGNGCFTTICGIGDNAGGMLSNVGWGCFVGIEKIGGSVGEWEGLRMSGLKNGRYKG